MPPLVEVQVIPSRDRQWGWWGGRTHFKPAKESKKYDDQPLPIRPSENQNSSAHIVGRNVDESGVHYRLTVGDVKLNDVALEEILDYVSALDLEEFENREFEQEREVLRVQQAELAREQEEMREQVKQQRAKRKGTVIYVSDVDDQIEADKEGDAKRGRARPDYTQFYLKPDLQTREDVMRSDEEEEVPTRPAGSLPSDVLDQPGTAPHLQPLHSREPVKRRRRRRDPVTGELMPLPEERNPLSEQLKPSTDPSARTSPIAQELKPPDHRKRPRRQRHPITKELMPLGWRYDPSAPGQMRKKDESAPSLKQLSITEQQEAKRMRFNLEDDPHRAVTPAVGKAEVTPAAGPRPQSPKSTHPKATVINLLSSDEDEEIDDAPAIKNVLEPILQPPATFRSNKLMVQSTLSPRGTVQISSPSKQSLQVASPAKTSLMNPSAVHAVSSETSAPQSPVDDVDDAGSDEEWYVEDILTHTLSDPDTHPPQLGSKSVMLYQVKWLDHAEPTWEPAESFDDKTTIEAYWKRAGSKKSTSLAPDRPENPHGKDNISVGGSNVAHFNAAVPDDNASTDDVEYEVERIDAHHMSDPQTHPGKPATMLYKVKWKGYQEATYTWEPATSFEDKAVLRKYQERHGLPVQ